MWGLWRNTPSPPPADRYVFEGGRRGAALGGWWGGWQGTSVRRVRTEPRWVDGGVMVWSGNVHERGATLGGCLDGDAVRRQCPVLHCGTG